MSTAQEPRTGAIAVVQNAVDPARREDVLLRVRREEGHEVSPWWLVGAFVFVAGTVVALMSLIPGGGV
ncbi:UDP-N-acetylmuramyl pentapeptide phosphotransferase [Microbacterium sp. NPDC078428]|uniref:UDP-N-acetylmuramyl pentapeptide phosphotransferase n=1 Tax=Microbacterium limosum TaxID=3079935 RepID=A0AAU0MFI9_9MICO|nr:UDP-N-acetylmuramyl pentapeptide phosphotransferase [Microbacterium sp. Y20]WOQ68920.1 UDP-N-acetylmuramyl pentapeptide phosphotransferase [Microbacterium sp. Y20]